MSHMFCPQCGSIMMPEKSGSLRCPRCGYTKTIENSRNVVVASTKVKRNPSEKIIVLDSNKPRTALPRTRDVRCPKCGNNEAEYWFLQTRRADEPPTRFYKCVKCGHVWREYE